MVERLCFSVNNFIWISIINDYNTALSIIRKGVKSND